MYSVCVCVCVCACTYNMCVFMYMYITCMCTCTHAEQHHFLYCRKNKIGTHTFPYLMRDGTNSELAIAWSLWYQVLVCVFVVWHPHTISGILFAYDSKPKRVVILSLEAEDWPSSLARPHTHALDWEWEDMHCESNRCIWSVKSLIIAHYQGFWSPIYGCKHSATEYCIREPQSLLGQY